MNEWIGKNRDAIAILRVSSHRQRDNLSHDIQAKEIEAYYRTHNLDLVRTVRFIESAKDSEKRLKYHEAIEFALENGIRHILFYMGDREARNLTDNEYNEKLVLQDRIVLHYVSERKILHANSPESDFTARDYQAVGNKDFSRRLRVKVRDAMMKKAEDGWFPSNHLPLGYAHQRRRDEFGRELKRGTIVVPDPYEKNVRQAQREFELRGFERMTLTQIKDQLIVEGFITQKKGRNYESSIERRLKNKFYSGYYDWPKKSRIEHKGKHELIIPPRLFQLVQETFGGRGLYSKKEGIFSGGWIRCGNPECGCFITYDPKNKTMKSTKEVKTYHLYRCSNGKKVHQDFRGAYVHEEKIWEQLSVAIESISIDEDFAKEMATALNETQKQVQEAAKKEMQSYRDGLIKLDDRESELYEDFKSGVLDEEGYRRQVARLKQQRLQFTESLEKANAAISDAGFETVRTTIELARDAKSLWLSRSPDERRQFLDELLSNRVLDGTNVRYDLKKPFATLVEMKENENWRPLVDDFRTDSAEIHGGPNP